MDGTPGAGANTARNATLLDPRARTAIFIALHPALDALAVEASTDARLSPHAPRVLHAVTRAHPADSLALTELDSPWLPHTPHQHRSPPDGSPTGADPTDVTHPLAPSRTTRVIQRPHGPLPRRRAPT